MSLPDAPGALAHVDVPTDVGVGVMFLLGLVGSVHCLGMCGPLVTVYADRIGDDGPPAWRELRQHGLFNAGRTVSYAAIGAALGALGGAVFEVASLAAVGDAVRSAVGLAVGTLIVVVGVGYLTRGAGGGTLHGVPLFGDLFGRVTGALTAHVDRWVGGPRIVGLGLVHGLLPCPLLYPAYLYAFARGDALYGGVALAALGLGTFPTLFAYGTAFGSLDAGHRDRAHRVLGVVFVLLGTVPLAHALGLLGVQVPHVPLPVPRGVLALG